MLPRILHLVWIGEETPQVRTSIAHWKEVAGDREVRVQSDDRELLPELRATWKRHASTPLLKSDLLRWSLLARYGGWYFDMDCRSRMPLDDIEAALKMDGSRCLVTWFGHQGGMLNSDMIACSPDWRGMPAVLEYLKNQANLSSIRWLDWAVVMLGQLYCKDPSAYLVGTSRQFHHRGGEYESTAWVLRHCYGELPEIITPTSLEVNYKVRRSKTNTESVFVKVPGRVKRYLTEVGHWVQEGRPERTDEEVDHIYDTYCLPCKWFNAKGSCKLCGCRISKSKHALINKLRMATTRCPASPPKWDYKIKPRE